MSPETYAWLKHLHRACAALSVAGFAWRWLALQAGQAWVRRRPARTLPHVVDTLLLGSALALAFGGGWSPLAQPWLAAKIVLLLLYIGLGFVALSARRSAGQRWAAGAAALLVFGHIVAMALTKQLAGLLA